MLLVGGQHLPGVGFVHDEDMVQGLTPDAPDNPFAVGVHPGNSRRALEVSISSAWKTASNDCPYLPSRSRSRNRRESPTPAKFGGNVSGLLHRPVPGDAVLGKLEFRTLCRPLTEAVFITKETMRFRGETCGKPSVECA